MQDEFTDWVDRHRDRAGYQHGEELTDWKGEVRPVAEVPLGAQLALEGAEDGTTKLNERRARSREDLK